MHQTYAASYRATVPKAFPMLFVIVFPREIHWMQIKYITRALLLTLACFTPLRPVQAQTLTGAIDIHAHSDPDGMPRSIDAIDLAKLAKSRGMRAIVLKNHYEPTASLAYIVRKEVPGIEVFGGISLDLTNGGVNPAAVEWMTKVKGGYGRVVWFPTFDSEHNAAPQHRPFAPVAKDGKLLPDVVKVISIIAQHNLVFGMRPFFARRMLAAPQ